MLKVLFLIWLVSAVVASATPSEGAFSTYAANSAIARQQGNGLRNGSPLVDYPDGEFQWALRLLFERTGNKSYFDYIHAGVDRIVNPDGSIANGAYKFVHLIFVFHLVVDVVNSFSDYTLDPLRLGQSFIYLLVLS